MPTPTTLSPLSDSRRIASLDVLRGFAVLGILLMNVQSFSMIEAAYFNPAASPYFTTPVDRWIWVASHLLADQKFMTLFSVLFGAGIVLMAERAEAAGKGATALHYRRSLGLLAIGAVHAYLLWYGDVLVWYALCAFVVFWFRGLRPSYLFVLGLAALTLLSLIYLLSTVTMPDWPPDVLRAVGEGWQPSAERIARETAAYRGSWSEQMAMRVPMSLTMHTFNFVAFAAWRAGGLMLIGMALYKWGILSAERSARFYGFLAITGLSLGLPLVARGVVRCMADGWTLAYARFSGVQYNHWGSLLVSAGYLGWICRWCLSSRFATARRAVAAVGRMALSHYLLQTVLCTWIFYGHGLGLYGAVGRAGQLAIVVGVWLLQLAVSPLWLARYRFGPAEWLWRSLVYLEPQPFRRTARFPYPR